MVISVNWPQPKAAYTASEKENIPRWKGKEIELLDMAKKRLSVNGKRAVRALQQRGDYILLGTSAHKYFLGDCSRIPLEWKGCVIWFPGATRASEFGRRPGGPRVISIQGIYFVSEVWRPCAAALDTLRLDASARFAVVRR